MSRANPRIPAGHVRRWFTSPISQSASSTTSCGTSLFRHTVRLASISASVSGLKVQATVAGSGLTGDVGAAADDKSGEGDEAMQPGVSGRLVNDCSTQSYGSVSIRLRRRRRRIDPLISFGMGCRSASSLRQRRSRVGGRDGGRGEPLPQPSALSSSSISLEGALVLVVLTEWSSLPSGCNTSNSAPK